MTTTTATIPRMAINITDPSYISGHMLDKVVKEKFHDNADDAAVRDQMFKFLQIFRASTTHDQTIVDYCMLPEYRDAIPRRALPRLDS